jgi:hypothetical protein
MSDTHIDPDLACEVIILEPDGTSESALGAPSAT